MRLKGSGLFLMSRFSEGQWEQLLRVFWGKREKGNIVRLHLGSQGNRFCNQLLMPDTCTEMGELEQSCNELTTLYLLTNLFIHDLISTYRCLPPNL